MASAYKNIAALVGATGDVTIYTCPTATEAVVKNLNLYNSHSGTIVVYPKITDSSASVRLRWKKTASELSQTRPSLGLSYWKPAIRSY